MKFARDFKDALRREEYPQEWVDSAISYKKLKKCIKRVQEELQNMGLDPATLEHLWQQGTLAPPTLQKGHLDRGMSYEFLNDGNVKFTPKLLIALDPTDGSPMDAWLSPETRRILRQYGRRSSLPQNVQDVVPSQNEAGETEFHAPGSPELSETATLSSSPSSSSQGSPIEEREQFIASETIEVPLTSDSEFFQILRRELSTLESLQNSEQEQLERQITKLGEGLRDLQTLKKKKRATKEEIETWRDIFRLYTESEVFFSSHEHDAGKRDATHAQQQLTNFNKLLQTQRNKQHFKLSHEGIVALEKFMRINVDLLKLLKYQEINRVALTKIMKKFDKRTALHAQEGALAEINKTPFIAQDLAKATCFIISDEVLKIIPQLDDYLCPICFSISWKPIRLRCKHVFCIRCLIVMQRADQDKCPLCREQVILEASSENLDMELLEFLKKNFKGEVREKQKQNEHAAGVDLFGPNYKDTHRCTVM